MPTSGFASANILTNPRPSASNSTFILIRQAYDVAAVRRADADAWIAREEAKRYRPPVDGDTQFCSPGSRRSTRPGSAPGSDASATVISMSKLGCLRAMRARE